MRKYVIIAVTLVFGLGATGLAQNEQDALDLSRDEITGSARSVAMGGAFTALGGDISGAYLNPGGIAVFHKNEFSMSPAFHTSITSSDYYGRSTLGSKANLNIATLGLVGVSELENQGKWRSTAMAFGMHRSYAFHRNYSIRGSDVPSSLIDSYVNTLGAKGITPDDLNRTGAYPFDIYLAWNNFILDYDTLDATKFYNATGELPIDQSYEAQESGAKRETYFSFGGNYDDVLYIGGSVNFSRIIFERSYTHSEFIDPADTTTALQQYSFEFDEEMSGLGAAISIGAIYRPISSLRIGASVKSPTLYSLDHTYDSYNAAVFTEGRVFESQSPEIGRYEFRLVTPWKANVGLAYMIGKLGMISTDMEYVDYSTIMMQGITDFDNYSNEESAIRTNLKPTVNIRTGAEFRMTPNWSLRGGFAAYGSPYKSDILDDGSFRLYSLGFGYRDADFFVDAAYQVKTSEQTTFLYDPTLVDAAEIQSTDHRMTLTFGFAF